MSAIDLTTKEISTLTGLLKLKAVELELQLSKTRQNSKPVTLDQQSVGRVSRIDAIQQQQMAVANHEQSTLLLKQVSAGLRRVESGEYGYCLQCGDPIGFARLEAQPYTPRCLDCQSAIEQK